MSSTRHERGAESFPPLKLIFETALLLCRTHLLVKPLQPKKTDTSAIVICTSGPVSEVGGFFGTNTYEYYGRKTLTQIATRTSLHNSVSTDGYEKQCACCARHACPMLKNCDSFPQFFILANPASSSRLFALVPVSLPQHVTANRSDHGDGEFDASNSASPVQTRLWRVCNVQILFYCWT